MGGGGAMERGGGSAMRLQNQIQVFSGGVSKTERALVAGTDGSVAQVEENIAQAVRTFGAPPGAKKMMDAERAAAEEAMRTGLYGVWRNASSGHDFCGRIGPSSRCFCGHECSDHVWSKPAKGKKATLLPSCSKCSCTGFHYMPRRPEEVGEWWLPRRRGFDVRLWRAKCKCQHSHEDHDPNHLGCRSCGCSRFTSAWLCTGCEGKWEDHETLWETEEERRLQGLPVGQAFMPLASTPQIQQMVLGDGSEGSQRSYSLPHRPRPERSVQLMRERCPNYGGGGGAAGSLEDAFPPQQSRGRAPIAGSLEEAFPPARSCGAAPLALGSLEDAFPPRRGTGSSAGAGEDSRPRCRSIGGPVAAATGPG
eukprot:CAMPEP_0180746970 /NCGR_PEP_ID=MMETSP1038_2-20121128/29302_1 /TAXON_ID=632150 /ORGANISM="Azadinium spinosum, Strain 3D9" /LENGTH=364 /DNA_ID=CAMNT_0022780563 /DNA_START=101 /DNA_END=1192 /DNA_ORIENTATION=-